MMKHIIFVAKASVIAIITVYYAVLAVSSYLLSGRFDSFYNYTRKWSRGILKIIGVKLSIEGNENISAEDTFVVISNHSSLLDIPVIFTAMGCDVRIIYKKQLQKIPVFGWCLRNSPYISVDREDPRNAMKSIDDAVRSIAEGVSVIVFPEGTRSPDGKLGSFKRGAFLLATRAGKQILPVSIMGTAAIMPARIMEFNPGKVTVRISVPIMVEQPLSRPGEKQLMENIHTMIEKNLFENI